MKHLNTLFFGFPEGFFGFLWFSLILLVSIFCFIKTLGKTPKKRKKTNPYPRVGMKPLRYLFAGFPEGLFGFLWFSYVFLVLSKVFWFCKNFGKQKIKKTKPICKGGSETFKNFVLFSLGFFVFFDFLLYFWFSRFFWFCKNHRENQKPKQDQTHIQTQGAQGRNNSLTYYGMKSLAIEGNP